MKRDYRLYLDDIIIPSTDDIIAINQKLGCTVLNKGMIDFISQKLKQKFLKGTTNGRSQLLLPFSGSK